ncbi:uracil-DNA glycosylase family protein [Desulforhopalus vacuolatus]|uniref:uracil-DNA glycosylase family protein n=1 Tax=Desulforhopalus vacuolatus TaxID=40414 RepID=UPI0019630D37|nr:uracil-DNA glycosylase family protein [Desulforhopalus vacuolatus]MBM9521098.1 uracil-DNA glycosylase family protein [Desulforhopalus vacuolatus]
MIEKFIEKIPSSLKDKSGSVFYSGVDAFSGNKDLYILGLNPGGSPEEQSDETIKLSIRHILENESKNWSAYRDESWQGAEPGTWKIQPRVLHLLKNLNLDPGEVPSSNVIFVRSQRESNISDEASDLIEQCWPFHSSVISELKPKAILCFGKTAGQYLKKKLGANKLIDEFVETNNRRWKSQAFMNKDGIKVIVAAHPSIADWTAPDTDPSKMIQRVIASNT